MADIVYMVRHAAPPGDGPGRYWGRTDPGVRADSLAYTAGLFPMFWEAPEVIIESPLRRATLTGEPFAQQFSLTPEVDEDLAETDFGAFDGMTWLDIALEYPDAAALWAEQGDAFAFPDGESIPAFLARAESSWRRTVERREKAVLAVSHGGIIAAWCCLFLRMPLAQRFSFRPAYSALSAFVRKKDGSGWEMVFLNNII